MDKHEYTVELNDRTIDVTEREWVFPTDPSVMDRCRDCLQSGRGNVGELYSDFWVGGVKIPGPGVTEPAIEMQMKCEGVCDGATTCALKMLQFSADGQVQSEFYADQEHEKQLKKALERPERTVCLPPPAKKRWWQKGK